MCGWEEGSVQSHAVGFGGGGGGVADQEISFNQLFSFDFYCFIDCRHDAISGVGR